MIKLFRFVVVVATLMCPQLCLANSLLPAPLSAVYGHGDFTLHDGDTISFPQGDAKAEWTAQYLIDLLGQTQDLQLKRQERTEKVDSATIAISRCITPFAKSTEAYELHIDAKGIRLCAKSDAGLFYAAASLWQLVEKENSFSIPFLQIQDAPRFSWRGMLLDSARHYQSPEFIKKLINVLALHKLNVLHWHLTDDQAWRLEIKQYPRLTSFAAWRVPAGLGAEMDIDSSTGRPRLYGGFYSQEQVKEIVQYASDRNITIVPEIEMPGHSTAAIVAYPFLASISNPPDTIPHDWGVFPYLYNVGDDSFRFLENVLDEVIALFPGPFIHVGGDEAIKDQWKASPQAQEMIRKLGLKDEDALQGWFIQKIEKYVEDHGKRIIGWDEILSGGLGPTAAVMSWHGIDGATKAAQSGHDAVLTPAPNFYFDGRMNTSAYQPPGAADSIITLESVYTFNPVPTSLNESEQKHILGMEGAVWTEGFRTESQISLVTFPRELAIAELAWSGPKKQAWPNFLSRIPKAQERLSSLGMEYSDSPFEPMPLEQEQNNGVHVSFSNQTNFGEIRYTLDGQDPSSSSNQYQNPLMIPIGRTIRVATFQGSKKISNTKERNYSLLSLHTKSSFDMRSCFPGSYNEVSEDDAPVNGPRALFIVNYLFPCWVYEGADLSEPLNIVATVGQLPFNLQIGSDVNLIHYRKPATPEGELEVRLDDCLGFPIATIPLKSAVNNPATTRLPETALPVIFGRHNLCFTFTQWTLDPYWVIDRVSLVGRENSF